MALPETEQSLCRNHSETHSHSRIEKSCSLIDDALGGAVDGSAESPNMHKKDHNNVTLETPNNNVNDVSSANSERDVHENGVADEFVGFAHRPQNGGTNNSSNSVNGNVAVASSSRSLTP